MSLEIHFVSVNQSFPRLLSSGELIGYYRAMGDGPQSQASITGAAGAELRKASPTHPAAYPVCTGQPRQHTAQLVEDVNH